MPIDPSQLQLIFSQLQQAGIPGSVINNVLIDLQRDGLAGLERSLTANQIPGANQLVSQLAQSGISFNPQQQGMFARVPTGELQPSTPAQPQAPDTFGVNLLGGLVPGSRFPTLPLDQEAKAYKGVSDLEQADLERARQKQLEETLATQGLFQEAGTQDAADYASASQGYLDQGNSLFNQNLTNAQTALAPIFQEQLRRNAESLGAKLPGSDFNSSGAFQQLAGQNATQLGLEAYRQAAPGLFQAQNNALNLASQGRLAQQPYRQAGLERRLGAQDQFALGGYEANLTPANFRRDLFNRGLDENARLADFGGQFEFADAAAGRANAANSAARKAGITSALISGAGSLLGGAAAGGIFSRKPRTAPTMTQNPYFYGGSGGAWG